MGERWLSQHASEPLVAMAQLWGAPALAVSHVPGGGGVGCRAHMLGFKAWVGGGCAGGWRPRRCAPPPCDGACPHVPDWGVGPTYAAYPQHARAPLVLMPQVLRGRRRGGRGGHGGGEGWRRGGGWGMRVCGGERDEEQGAEIASGGGGSSAGQPVWSACALMMHACIFICALMMHACIFICALMMHACVHLHLRPYTS